MAWTKYFQKPSAKNMDARRSGGGNEYGAGYKNYSSVLPDVYSGHPNRVERYVQYDAMDQDSEVNAALDILAEFCTQDNTETKLAFAIEYYDDATETEVEIIETTLRQWCNLQSFKRKAFKIFRNVLKYGDQIFIRDPETNLWFYTDPSDVEKVIVDESAGKEIVQYVVRDVGINLQTLAATEKTNTTTSAIPSMLNRQGSSGQDSLNRYNVSQESMTVDAKHVVHLSMTEEMDLTWPFGRSLLEDIFKVYKQKELLEDAIIIYRVQRAPERRVFYIDVGNMPPFQAMGFVDRVKNEIHQRRIPTQSGGSHMMDATYNPMSIMEDYFFPQTGEGRGSKVETLPGGENLGQIDDLKFFSNKLYRALRIPSSYLPSGPDDSTATYNDGRMGTALIQEYRFNEYCKRLQNIVSPVFDKEFKKFLRIRGVSIDNSLFELCFNAPQNFASYRQSELDTANISAFSSVADLPFMSKRFAMKRYLGMTEEEMLENATLWAEEKSTSSADTMQGSDLRSVGVTPGGLDAGMEGSEMPDDFDNADLEMDDADTGDMEIDADEPMDPEV